MRFDGLSPAAFFGQLPDVAAQSHCLGASRPVERHLSDRPFARHGISGDPYRMKFVGPHNSRSSTVGPPKRFSVIIATRQRALPVLWQQLIQTAVLKNRWNMSRRSAFPPPPFDPTGLRRTVMTPTYSVLNHLLCLLAKNSHI